MSYTKGHKFYGPNGQGYELTEDVITGQTVRADHFKPFGGAPVPKPNHPMPDWLHVQIMKAGK